MVTGKKPVYNVNYLGAPLLFFHPLPVGVLVVDDVIVFLIYMLILAACTAAAYFLTPKAKRPPDPAAASPDDFEFPTAQEGKAIPVLFGTKRIKGLNVIDWGNVRSVKVEESIG